MAVRGGKRPGAGRKPGKLNNDKAELRDLASVHTETTLARLVQLISSPNEAVALGAVKELFDRAHGKAPQAITGANDTPLLPSVVPVINVFAHDPNAGAE